jgi:hypothetical protein
MTEPHAPQPTRSPAGAPSGTVQRILRMSLLGSVLLFGLIVWFVHRQGAVETAPLATELRLAMAVLLAGSAVGIVVLGRRYAAEPDAVRASTLRIVSWAAGETPAVFGAVLYLLSGSPGSYLLGVGMLLTAFLLVPVRE